MENKTGKYLKYALGEVVLVVIGILIALSINNWNEERANKKIELTYMKNLLEDLAADTNNYTDYAKRNLEVYALIDSLVTHLNRPDRNEYADKTVYWARIMTTKFSRAQPVERTFEQMKSSGQLKLIKNQKVADGISQYYNSLSNLHAYNEASILWLADYLKSVGKVFDGEVLLNILKTGKAQQTGPSVMITEDRAVINELISSAQYIYGVVSMADALCQKRNESAQELMALITNEYQIKE